MYKYLYWPEYGQVQFPVDYCSETRAGDPAGKDLKKEEEKN